MRKPTDIAADIRRWMETFTVRSMHEWMRAVRAAGLTMPQVGLLMVLRHGGQRTVHELGAHLGISNPAASMLVDRLVRAGLAARAEEPGDRRIRRIGLTATGRSFVERSLRERDAWAGDLAANLSRDEEAALRRVLPALMEAERRLGASHPPAPFGAPPVPPRPGRASRAGRRVRARS